jgi:uncharacterized membrane protein YdjX (TVP38/TMEM64 family)
MKLTESKLFNLTRDFGVIILSIAVAVILVKTGMLKNILTSTQEWEILGSFIAGVFFVSVFTVAPAAVLLVQIAQENSILTVAIFGSLGALVGDLIIFRFLRDGFSRNLLDLIMGHNENKIVNFLKSLKFLKWLWPLVGALIIISPFPDEIGLLMMGISKVKTHEFAILAFILNFIGIFIMCSVLV